MIFSIHATEFQSWAIYSILVCGDNTGIIVPYFLTLANRNAQDGQRKYNSVAVAGVIALNSMPMLTIHK